MRTTFIKTAFLIALLLAAWLPGAICLAAGEVASIITVEGDVQVKESSGSDWVAAEPGIPVDEGFSIKTGADASAVIEWSLGHRVKVFPLTVMDFAALSVERRGKKETTELNIESGKILAKSKKLASSVSTFKIQTPTAVAGVRGTTFMVEVMQDNSSSISLLDGELEVTGDQVDLVLEGNSHIQITTDSSTTPEPEPLPENTAREMQSETQNMEQAQHGGPPETSGKKGKGATPATPAKPGDPGSPADPAEPAEPATDPDNMIPADDIINTDEIFEQVIDNTIDDIINDPTNMPIIDDVVQQEDPPVFIPPMPPDR